MATTVTTTLSELRQELKAWEKAFAAAHDGRKAGKSDIKSDLVIAAKYKQYDRLARPERVQHSTPKKARGTTSRTPTKRTHLTASTPSRTADQRLQRSPGKPAFHPLQPTPQAIRRRLGPTPQKDGRILSLFDEPHDSPWASTPIRAPLRDIHTNSADQQTPSKARSTPLSPYSPEDTRVTSRWSRTPTSTGKRFMLDMFAATPSKRTRTIDEGEAETEALRPMSMDIDATPSFLRRRDVDFGQHDSVLDSPQKSTGRNPNDLLVVEGVSQTLATHVERHNPIPLFKRKTGLVRSLSSIIRGMKDRLEEEADADLDLLRELEAEQEARPVTRPRHAPPPPQRTNNPDVLQPMVKSGLDTQLPAAADDEVEMPLGPDTLPVSEDEASPDEEGQPRRVWKKKGLKRQTKRVNMRPGRRAPNTPLDPTQDPSNSARAVYDAALTTIRPAPSTQDGDQPSGSEFDDSDIDAALLDGDDKLTGGKVAKGGKEGAVGAKRKTKINPGALAHTNFCRLKIRGKGPKTGGGRFGRRR